MIRELVTQAEARSNLANVLSSTDRIGIIGLRDDGRVRFFNEGYRRLVDADPGHSVRELLANPANPPWELLVSTVEREGLWAGSVTVDAPNRPPDAPRRLHLSVARAADSSGVPIGHTLVFSDFSGEEERIRSLAVRTILDHVPYGLFRVDAEGEVLDGYSASCDLFFNVAGTAIKGKRVDQLLGLDQRRGEHLLVYISQVFDDVLPEEVSLGQIQRSRMTRCFLSSFWSRKTRKDKKTPPKTWPKPFRRSPLRFANPGGESECMDCLRMSSFMSGCSAQTLSWPSRFSVVDVNEAIVAGDCIGPTLRERFED
jgi:PAS domain-containing protein